jgi:hypothetical protein
VGCAVRRPSAAFHVKRGPLCSEPGSHLLTHAPGVIAPGRPCYGRVNCPSASGLRGPCLECRSLRSRWLSPRYSSNARTRGRWHPCHACAPRLSSILRVSISTMQREWSQGTLATGGRGCVTRLVRAHRYGAHLLRCSLRCGGRCCGVETLTTSRKPNFSSSRPRVLRMLSGQLNSISPRTSV